METLHLSLRLLYSVVEHARGALPAEAVGLLGGPTPDHATIHLPLPNVAGRRAYLADPFAQFQAERLLASRGYHLVAIYHSHPGGGLHLSPLDVAFARKRACAQLVIALDRPGIPGEDFRAYRVIDGAPREIGVRIEERSADAPAS